MDLSPFNHLNSHNGFELERLFAIKPDAAGLDEVATLTGCSNYRLAKALRRLGLRKPTLYVEPTYTFKEPPPPPPTGSIYFDGYFQSERYFQKVAGQLKERLTFRLPTNSRTKDLVSAIKSENSISVHVRRGDYLNKANAKIHGVLGRDYYRSSINKALDLLPDAKLYIFSDSIEWCRSSLDLSGMNACYVSHNEGKDSWQDMLLMSYCQVNILANSSFSWWGSWLNRNPEPIRIAPSPWFLSSELSDADLILPDTIKIGSDFQNL